jgi:glycosyltransferase involved in cell wall biosynthesis
MPVFNGEKYLLEAVKSILNQTYNIFELIIIDDGSKDGTWDILQSFCDHRICLIKNTNNMGVSRSRNLGIIRSKGKYIAFMDADDLSLPKRLERQVAFMEKNPEIGICGSWAEIIGSDRKFRMKRPINHDYLRIGLLFKSCFIHSSVMIRGAFFKYHKLYFKPNFEPSEDYELWVHSSSLFKMANIPEVLVYYRIHNQQASNVSRAIQEDNMRIIMKAQIEALNIEDSDEDFFLHESLVVGSYINIPDFPVKLEKWFLKLINANQKASIYPEKAFVYYLASLFFLACRKGNMISYLISLFVQIDSENQHGLEWISRVNFRLIGIINSLYLALKRNDRLF